MADAHLQITCFVFGHLVVELPKHAPAGAQYIALVVGVEAGQQLSVLADQRRLQGGGTGVNP